MVVRAAPVFHPPTSLPVILFDRLLELIRHDEKIFGDAPSWILPVGVGRAVVSRTVSEADLVAVLEERSV